MGKKIVPVVKQDSGKEVPVEVLAESIKAISEGVKKLTSGPLNKRTLYLLIQHNTSVKVGNYTTKRVGIAEIKAVIEGMETLAQEYLK